MTDTGLEKGTPAANRAERYVKMTKDETKTDMIESDCPMVFWDYCVERRAKIINSVSRMNPHLQGQVPESKMTGRPHDISNLCEYQWYEWVKYRSEGRSFPFPSERLGRVLGPAEHAGHAMSQWVLTDTGDVLPIQTCRKLTEAEYCNATLKEQMHEFDRFVRKRFGDSRKAPADVDQHPVGNKDFSYYDDDDDGTSELPEVDDIGDLDLYVDAEVVLPQNGEHMRAAKVIGRSRGPDGNAQGSYNTNPIINTRVYDVMFPDGAVQQYSANVIAENMMSQVDEDGHRYQMVDYIVDHRKDGRAIARADGFTTSKSGKKCLKRTTIGWQFLIMWKDGTESWANLKELKESFPVEVAEYVNSKGITEEPAFAWWVPFTLRKRDRVIAAVKSRARKKKTHKFGIRVPRSVREAYELDTVNGNTFWRSAVAKEMKNNRIAFEILDKDEEIEPGRTYMQCYMIFDVKMDMTRKARFVANGSKTPEPEMSTYAGVVSRETVRIALTYASLNGLDIMSSDIQNAYLQAPITEKYWTTCGPEFGPELQGRKARIVRALYGTKTAGADFRNHLRDCMEMLGYSSCRADPDLWMRKAVKGNGEHYYEYVLLYVDDCLCISEHPREAIEKIDKYFPMKPGSIAVPTLYLGAKISKVQLPNGVEAWAQSTSQYVQEAVRNVEKYLSDRSLTLMKGAATPLSANYGPELDVSPELDDDEATYYQSLIGVLRWMVEMGRVDIAVEVSMMSSYVAMPREGHLQQLFHIFAYLKGVHNARMVFDPSYPDVDSDSFEKKDWTKFYGDVSEEKPPDAPEPLGKEFLLRAYVDSDHAGEKLTRRSRTGFIVYMNSAPIHWMTKKQTAVETSSFGSEFMAMKHCTEYLRGLRYKLRMMGIPVNNPVFLYGDNQSVLWNTSVPDSMLKKKSNSIAYHFVREGVAKDEWRTSYVKTTLNPADLFTKALRSGLDRRRKVRMILYDIYPEERDGKD